MRLQAIIFLLTIVYSCQHPHKPERVSLDDKLMQGEWLLDSSSNRYFSYDRVILLDDGSFYLFSGADGGSLLLQGKKFTNDAIAVGFDTLKVNLLDSNRLYISGRWPNRDEFYIRKNYDGYHENLKECLKADSLRNKTIGWWKLTSNNLVRLINYDGYCKTFTLNIRDDGHAVFYLENNLDSIVEYSYRANADGIDLKRGCMVAGCNLSFDKKGRMKLVLDRRMGDTLILDRLTYIN